MLVKNSIKLRHFSKKFHEKVLSSLKYLDVLVPQLAHLLQVERYNDKCLE